jgi:outer membrane lipoprotein-sorting protein
MGDEMNCERFSRRNSRIAWVLAVSAAALTLGIAGADMALAEGGQTEVMKTVPSTPVQQTQQAQPQTAPQPQQNATSANAAKTPQVTNPVGAGSSSWQPAVATQTATPPKVLQASDAEIIAKVNGYFNGLTDL